MSRRPLLDGSSRQAGQSERVDVTRSRNSCQVAGWSKQGHRNSPPHFLPMGAWHYSYQAKDGCADEQIW